MRHFHPEEGEAAGKDRADWDDGGSSNGKHESGLAVEQKQLIFKHLF